LTVPPPLTGGFGGWIVVVLLAYGWGFARTTGSPLEGIFTGRKLCVTVGARMLKAELPWMLATALS
jgi:hypothetical protein